MALTEATKELKWISTLLAELGYSNGNSNDEPNEEQSEIFVKSSCATGSTILKLEETPFDIRSEARYSLTDFSRH
jgi:hypothetical protein